MIRNEANVCMLMMLPVDRIGFCANAVPTLIHNAHSSRMACTHEQTKRQHTQKIDTFCVAISQRIVSRRKCINKSHSSTWSCHLDATAHIFNDLFAEFDRTKKKTWNIFRSAGACVCVCVCWPKRIPCKPLQFYSTHLNVFEPQVGSRLTSSLHFTNESNTILVSCRLVFSFVVIFMAFHINTHVENCLWYVPCAAAPCFKFKETLCRSVCLDILYILTNRNFVFISLFT